MSVLMLEILLILGLVFLNGLLSMSEMAVVSSRKARLQQRAEAGDRRARAALRLAESPGPFLATIQIGITLVGILAGAFAGATLTEQIADRLRVVPFLAPYAASAAVAAVVVAITFLTLIFGELVPKRLALSQPEGIAALMAGPLGVLARFMSPVVRLLDLSCDLVLRLFAIQSLPGPAVTEEEVKMMIEQGTQVGVFEPAEQQMVERVFRLGDRKVNALMTPRRDIAWLNLRDTQEALRAQIVSCGYSRLPVADGSLDAVRGIVYARDLLQQVLGGGALDLPAVLQPAPFVPDTLPAFEVVARFRSTRSSALLVIDEYGAFQGMMTINDLLEAIVGDLPAEDGAEEPAAIRREDGTWLLDGRLSIERTREILQIGELPGEKDEYYLTLGGFVMSFLGRIPRAGDRFDCAGHRFEVVDMDERRVDQVLASPLPGGVLPPPAAPS